MGEPWIATFKCPGCGATLTSEDLEEGTCECGAIIEDNGGEEE